MATILYNNKAIIPAPLVNISKQYLKTGDGENIGATYSIVLTGTIVPYKGSPRGGTAAVAGFDEEGFWTLSGYPPDEVVGETERLKYVLIKQGALRKLFSVDGQLLEIQPLDGSTPLQCNPRVLDISFSENVWVDRCDYTITLEADTLRYAGVSTNEDGFDEYLSEASENWTIELDENSVNVNNEKSYRISHTITATGRRYFQDDGTLEKPAWEWAKDWVQAQMGFDTGAIAAFSSSVFANPVHTLPFNHIVTETVDEKAGSVSITETWLVANQTATEDFSINSTAALDDTRKNVTIEGTITGYESGSATKWDNAQIQFTATQALVFTRCQNYSGLTLNAVAISETITRNPVAGTIQYTYTYNDRPANYIPGAKSEVISIIDTNQTDIFAAIVVPGRTRGPVLQDINTSQATARSLNVEIVVDVPTGTIAQVIAAKPDISSLISDVENTLLPAFQIFKEQDEETWDFLNGRYNRQIRWVYERA